MGRPRPADGAPGGQPRPGHGLDLSAAPSRPVAFGALAAEAASPRLKQA